MVFLLSNPNGPRQSSTQNIPLLPIPVVWNFAGVLPLDKGLQVLPADELAQVNLPSQQNGRIELLRN